jgi:hypothetical protein
MTELTKLMLYGNQFTGTLPSELGLCEKLGVYNVLILTVSVVLLLVNPLPKKHFKSTILNSKALSQKKYASSETRTSIPKMRTMSSSKRIAVLITKRIQHSLSVILETVAILVVIIQLRFVSLISREDVGLVSFYSASTFLGIK